MLRETPAEWRKSIYYHYYEYPSVHMVPATTVSAPSAAASCTSTSSATTGTLRPRKDPGELTNLYAQPGTENLTADLKKQSSEDLRAFYQDDSDVPESLDAWKKESDKKRRARGGLLPNALAKTAAVARRVHRLVSCPAWVFSRGCNNVCKASQP
ncbi:MAG: DUF4976 domain-containing protein [Verrucomicrobiales bacterium]